MFAKIEKYSIEAPKYSEQVSLLTRRFQRAKLDTLRKKRN